MFAVGLARKQEGLVDFELKKPEIKGPKDVLVRVLQAGIDGTDRDMIQRGQKDIGEGEDFIVLGHEAVGRVEEVGRGVRNVKPGDIVVPTVRRGCGQCASCLDKGSDMCSTGLYKERGIHKLHGYFTEYFVDEEQYLVVVPPGLEEVAVLAEPMSIAEKAMGQVRHIQARLPWGCFHPEHSFDRPGWGACKKALVIGAGPIGFFGAALLRLADMVTYFIEIVPETALKVRRMQEMEAQYIDGRGITPESLVKRMGNPDIVFEASGASELALGLLPVGARNGAFVFTGIPRGQSQVCMDGDLLLRQMVRLNQIIIGSINSNRRHFEAALQNMVEIDKRFDNVLHRVITHSFALKDYRDAFAPIPDSLKVIFQVDEGAQAI
ncbi:MAG: alcohol dehydrogenase catalytic domain-containing protein [Chloroflexi bacterium]|nr:alcohol dehydrogenase catalytic domain-containing protein [Chloroflexota bacterium]